MSPLLKGDLVAIRLDFRNSFKLVIILVYITRLCEAALLAFSPGEGSEFLLAGGNLLLEL